MGADSVSSSTPSQIPPASPSEIRKEVSLEIGVGVNLAETFFNDGRGSIGRVINTGLTLDLRTDRYTLSSSNERLKLIGGLYSSGSINSESGFQSVSVVGGLSLQANLNIGKRGKIFAGVQGGLGMMSLNATFFPDDADDQKFTDAGLSGGGRVGFGVDQLSEKVPLGLSVYVESTESLCTIDNFSAVTNGAAMMAISYHRK